MQSNHIKPPENHIFANFFRLQGQIQNDFPPLNYILGGCIPAAGIIILAVGSKQAENGLQSRSSKIWQDSSVALWIELTVILNWRYGMVLYGLVWLCCLLVVWGGVSDD